MVAALLDSFEWLKRLVEAGADVNQKISDADPRTALSFAYSEDAIKLLIDKGADVNQTDSTGRNVLFKAIKFHDLEFIKWLVTKGVNLNQKDIVGDIPLKYAEHRASIDGFFPIEIIQFLKEHGAE